MNSRPIESDVGTQYVQTIVIAYRHNDAHKQRFNTHNNQTKRFYQSKAQLNGRDFKKVVMLLQGETTENENNNIK